MGRSWMKIQVRPSRPCLFRTRSPPSDGSRPNILAQISSTMMRAWAWGPVGVRLIRTERRRVVRIWYQRKVIFSCMVWLCSRWVIQQVTIFLPHALIVLYYTEFTPFSSMHSNQKIMTGEKPFATIRKDLEMTTYRMRRGLPVQPANGSINNRLWALLVRCWETKPVDRPDIHEVLTTLQEIRWTGFLRSCTSFFPFFLEIWEWGIEELDLWIGYISWFLLFIFS